MYFDPFFYYFLCYKLLFEQILYIILFYYFRIFKFNRLNLLSKQILYIIRFYYFRFFKSNRFNFDFVRANLIKILKQ